MGRKKQKKFGDHLHRIFGIANNKHTGKLIPAKQSSFGILFLLLLFFIPNIGLSKGLLGQQTSSGTVNVTLTATGPPPTSTPVIEAPIDGSSFDYRSMLVSGTCEYGYMVKVFNNSQFIGSNACDNTNHFGLVVTLAWGSNSLIARHYDGLDQAGPDSNIVNITINKPPLNLGLDVNNSNLYLNPNETGSWQISITNGVPPFTVIINWGDGSAAEEKIINSLGSFNISHKYASPGSYSVRLAVTDSADQEYILTFGVIVNGIPAQPNHGGGTVTTDKPTQNCQPNSGFWSIAGSETCPSSLVYRMVPIYWSATALMGLLWFAHIFGSLGFIESIIAAIVKFIKLITPL